MRKIFLVVIALVVVSVVSAQSPLEIGKLQLNAGFGFSSWGLPIYGGIDYGVMDDITVGAEGSFRAYNDNILGTKYTHTVLGVAANGNYHFNSLLDIPSERDFYAGLNVGFYIWNSSGNYPGNHASGLGLGAQVGGRYFFSNNFGLNLELGGGSATSGGKFGITYIL